MIPSEYMNQIVTGDARELAKRIPDESVDLVIADPPYFEITSSLWDSQWASRDAWADWCLEWASEIVRVLKPNGSAYIFGDDKNIAYMQVRLDTLAWGLVNALTWVKSNYTQLKSNPDALRCFRVQGEERILFYAKDVAGEQSPIAQYIRSERERAHLSRRKVAEWFPSKTGGTTGCLSNWELGKNFPTKEVYECLQKQFNHWGVYDPRRPYLTRPYSDFERTFKAFEHTDVWTGPLMPGLQKRHLCEKPQWLARRIILSSSKPGDVVLEPFCGSGAFSIAAYQHERNYIAFEVDPLTAHKARHHLMTTQPPLQGLFAEATA